MEGGVPQVGWGTSASRNQRNLAFTCSILNPGALGYGLELLSPPPHLTHSHEEIDPT